MEMLGFRRTAVICRFIFKIFDISKKVKHINICIGRGKSALHHGLPESKLAKTGTMGTES